MSTNPTIQKANKLERAQDRLDRAVAKLEAAARPSPPPPAPPPGADPEVLAKAESENKRLADLQAQAERENRRLGDVQTQVERRLDATIQRLKTLLEE